MATINTILKAIMICVICAVTLMSGCIDSTPVKDYAVITPVATPEPITIEDISGIDTITTTHADHVVVSGIDNVVYIENKNVVSISVSGIDNLVYYPKESNPDIIRSGIDNTITMR